MAKDDGGGVNIRSGPPWLPSPGERPPKLKHATDPDTHLTEKERLNRARARRGIPPGPAKPKAKPSKCETMSEKKARARLKSSPKEVIVEERREGKTVKVRTVKRG